MKNITIKKIVHYSINDPKFEEDYYSIDFSVIIDGSIKFQQTFGDYYHDKGLVKVNAIIDFIKAFYPEANLSIECSEIADEDF